VTSEHLSYEDVAASKQDFRESERISSAVRSLLEKNGVEELSFLIAPSEHRKPTWGRSSLGLRTFFVCGLSQDLLITTALHEYLHCWLGFRKFGPSSDQDRIISKWTEIISDWASGSMDIELRLDLHKVGNSLWGFNEAQHALQKNPTAANARRLFDRITRFFAKMIDAKCVFEETFDDRYLELAFEDKTEGDSLILEVETNPTLLEHADTGNAAACLSYALIIEDIDRIMKSHVLVETSYEEAVCYMMSCAMTGLNLEAFDGMTDKANITLAGKITGLGVEGILDRLRSADDTWTCIREIFTGRPS
jgi:hypothetical protein